MAEQGIISADQSERAKRSSIGARRDPPSRPREAQVAAYFVEAVRRVLEDHFGEDLYTVPLRVYTTLDRAAQRAAEEELSKQLRAVENGAFGRYKGKRYTPKAENLEETEYVQGAMVVLNARTGGVLAHVGGRDFRQSRFDRVTRARRQAGSAFKPFVYAAALSEGYTASQPIKDEPLKMELEGGEVWEPKNITGDFRGQMTMRQALVQSRNIPTIRLAAEVGLNDVARVARQSGIRSSIPESPAMAIGTAAVTPLELARAYTPFASLGTSVLPRWIRRVEDADGNVVWEPEIRRNHVLDEGVAYLVTNMLQDAVDHGTGSAVRNVGFRGPAAGKTGTTNDGNDVWFVGYTPNYVAAVWVGFDNPREIVDDASGGRIAAPVWGRVMRRIYASRKMPAGWEAPETIVRRFIDPRTGFLLAEGCKPQRGAARREMFLSYAQPATTCPSGKPENEPGFFSRAFAWARAAWHDLTEWIGDRVGRERERDRPRDRYLGVPKLREPQEVPAPVIDSTMIIELDTMPMIIELDTFPTDTFAVDTFMIDTLPPPLPDTMVPDTIVPDTVRFEGEIVDTTFLEVDTLQVGKSAALPERTWLFNSSRRR